MKRMWLKVMILLFAGIVGTGATVAAKEKVTVLLDWFVNPDHAPLFVALEKGYFAEKGLEVELIAPSNPNDPPKLVAAGKNLDILVLDHLIVAETGYYSLADEGII